MKRQEKEEVGDGGQLESWIAGSPRKTDFALSQDACSSFMVRFSTPALWHSGTLALGKRIQFSIGLQPSRSTAPAASDGGHKISKCSGSHKSLWLQAPKLGFFTQAPRESRTRGGNLSQLGIRPAGKNTPEMDKHVSISAVTAFWLLFAIIGFAISYRYEERGIIRCCVILTAVCCYLAWLVTFLVQLNPLIGPRANQKVIFGMITYWDNSLIHNKKDP